MSNSNVKRFHARTSREAFRMVREALGDDAVILSTQPAGAGVEVLAMTPEAMREVEQSARPTAPTAAVAQKAAAVAATLGGSSADEDAARMEMSTLSFQDYVRRRMLKRRQAELGAQAPAAAAAAPAVPAADVSLAGSRLDVRVDDDLASHDRHERTLTPAAIYAAASAAAEVSRQEARSAAAAAPLVEPPFADDPIRIDGHAEHDDHAYGHAPSGAQIDAERAAELLAEMRSMKGLIEERFGALAFMEKLQRRPAEARLTQKLLDCGFSPALTRKLAESLPHDLAGEGDEAAWAAQILERNVRAMGLEHAIETRGGVYALVGATGVGKTTTTAKIAAAFAARHGANQLGLVTLDAYRVGAQEQLRAYGRILGVPVHTAHDRASLEDLLELLAGKKLVLIDTAGMAQRDTRTRELLEMVSHPSIKKVVVVSAAAQGETIEDVVSAYRAAGSAGVVLSKIDEAVKLGPALDAVIRHKLSLIGVANGQRVPEDWHHLSAHGLVQRAMKGGGSSAWRFDAAEMNLVFAAAHGGPARRSDMAAA